MVNERQERLDEPALKRWANGFGIGLTLFHGVCRFCSQKGYETPVKRKR